MELEFRLMSSNDKDLLVEYEKRLRESEKEVFPDFNEAKYRENFRKIKIEDSPTNDVILCLHKGEVIGRIDLISEYSFMDFGSVGYIDWVYVMKPYRNNGIAKKLFEKAEKLFKDNNVEEYYLFVASNKEAGHFYESLDIEIKSVKKAYKKM